MPAQLDVYAATTTDPATDLALVVIRDLEKSSGTVNAVRGVSFEVRRGEVLGVRLGGSPSDRRRAASSGGTDMTRRSDLKVTNPSRPWYTTVWFVRVAQLLGIAETAGGLVLIVLRHDEAQGYALLAIGAATIGSMPWVSRVRSD